MPFRPVLGNGMTLPIPVLIVRIDKVTRRNGTYELHIGGY